MDIISILRKCKPDWIQIQILVREEIHLKTKSIARYERSVFKDCPIARGMCYEPLRTL